jgi:putative Mg2+ transporter-C (MgtC) family protein
VVYWALTVTCTASLPEVRTHALVSLGSAVVTMLIFETTQHAPDALSRVMQGLLTGVGFLGAGVIIHHDTEHSVEGLTTAASVWITAILGIACGAGQGGIVLTGLLLALAVLLCGARRGEDPSRE